MAGWLAVAVARVVFAGAWRLGMPEIIAAGNETKAVSIWARQITTKGLADGAEENELRLRGLNSPERNMEMALC
jgi:hypothetical protein